MTIVLFNFIIVGNLRRCKRSLHPVKHLRFQNTNRQQKKSTKKQHKNLKWCCVHKRENGISSKLPLSKFNEPLLAYSHWILHIWGNYMTTTNKNWLNEKHKHISVTKIFTIQLFQRYSVFVVYSEIKCEQSKQKIKRKYHTRKKERDDNAFIFVSIFCVLTRERPVCF